MFLVYFFFINKYEPVKMEKYEVYNKEEFNEGLNVRIKYKFTFVGN